MEVKFPVRELPVLYDSSLVSQTNQQAKAPMFSRFTWTQSLHILSKPAVPGAVEDIMNTFSEDRKKYERMKQMRFALAEGPETLVAKTKPQPQIPPLKKPLLKPAESLSDEEEEQARTKKQAKPSLATRVTSSLDKLEQLMTSRGDVDAMREQIADMTKHTKKKRMFQMETWKEKYEELFGDRELLTERTSELDRAFTRRVDEIQRLLSPEYKANQQTLEEASRRRQLSSQARKKAPEAKDLIKERYFKLRERERAASKAAMDAKKERSPKLTKRSTDRLSKRSLLGKTTARSQLLASFNKVKP